MEEKCLICNEAITNPVCPDCLERQVMYWVNEKQPSLVRVLKRVGDSVKTFDVDNTHCIICKRSMNICPHCYCLEIYQWLKDNETDLAGNFLERFNFELDYRFEQTPSIRVV